MAIPFVGHSDVSGVAGKDMKQKKLIFFVAEDWYFCSHRLQLAVDAKNAGYIVRVVTRVRDHGDVIQKAGLKLLPLDISRSGVNPLREVMSIARLIKLYADERPDVVHHVAMKPILYGLIAAFFTRVPCTVNAIAGMGFLFISKSSKVRFLRFMIMKILKTLLKRNGQHVILQNPDDVKLLCESGILLPDKVSLIKSSGVDADRFSFQEETDDKVTVVLASRLLWDKGVGEFVEAAERLKAQKIEARFVLVGDGDRDNPASISDAQLASWKKEGIVEVWGRRDDMPEVFARSHIVCLPSYREGLPKVLIEAAACGRPIVTTDVPGCREIVQDGVNGVLVKVRDVSTLADALKKLIESPQLRVKMGKKGRRVVEESFTVDRINHSILKLYESLVK